MRIQVKPTVLTVTILLTTVALAVLFCEGFDPGSTLPNSLGLKHLTERGIAAARGGANGGGGNPLGAEFADVAVRSLERARAINSKLKINGRSVEFDHLIRIAKSMKVQVSPVDLFLAEKSVLAINYPSKNEVIFAGSRWAKLPEFERQRLAVHEVLGLAKIDDDSYAVSRMMVNVREECRTHGCEQRREAMAQALFQFLKVGPSGDDGCLRMDDLISLEKITENSYRVVCGNGTSLQTLRLRVVQKNPNAPEFGQSDEYTVIQDTPH